MSQYVFLMHLKFYTNRCAYIFFPRSFTTATILLCGRRFEPALYITICVVLKKKYGVIFVICAETVHRQFSRFSKISEANALSQKVNFFNTSFFQSVCCFTFMQNISRLYQFVMFLI